jgi:hypothetical protein
MDAGEEMSEGLIVLVPQGDAEATAKVDSLNRQPRKYPFSFSPAQ